MKWLPNTVYTLLLIMASALVGYLYVDYTLQSPTRTKEIEVEIPPQSSVKTVGSILEKQNIIRDDRFFRYYAKWEGKTKIMAGSYVIGKEENIDEILTILTSGKENTTKVTIIEGSTALEIAETLHKQIGTNKEEFLKEVNRTNGKFAFEKQIPTKPEIKYKLEGYLFPSTYQFHKEDSPKKIVDTMLSRFEKEMKELNVITTPSEQKGKPLHELVTFASVLEREGQQKDELPKIAGVIENRLAKRMRLQVDASVVYAIQIDTGKKLTQVMKADYKYSSPYNTYQIQGFPPAPIGSPGANAYRAALSPEKHDYLYYVLKEDGTGYHDFTVNYQDHLKADQKAKSRR
ncbi:endolytic transglycosylase MltG [Thermoactinomyces sp. DSM 45892]|uniref:endolytic transglycosylase MltG n=1 Tax=Thermoactinomyces sp. DSM 45892 TaxID=1882753 RepID=UPI0008954C25|nr:endolytic transglycosylase MltG [Thermoactinomyces sp. DSM 45892]SDZ32159.1 UPF0755 protein [Thermoactinomyces sp. DSM 45892]